MAFLGSGKSTDLVGPRRIMSKEDGKLNQHIVPQAHLDRFTDSKTMLHVHRFIDDERVKVYPTHPKHVSAEDNYYDDDDPYAERSIETFLKHQESIGQPSVDRILESRSNIQENRPRTWQVYLRLEDFVFALK